ncbi:MAG: putative Signal transduction histidine kinase [Promethearchaeota archaeon]|nr:MAG: putative Signal transduction histidine kinase [Candidatus Lokiarchaeota archaeon]
MTIDKNEHNKAIKKENFKAMFEDLPVPIHYWKKIGDDFIFWGYNRANDELAGNILEGSVGKKASVIHRDEPHLLDLLKKSYEERKELFLETRYQFRGSEQKKFLRAHYKFIPPNYIIVATQDITKEKIFEEKLKELTTTLEQKVEKRTKELDQAKKKFKGLFMRSPFPIILFNKEGILIDLNEATIELFGVKDKGKISEYNLFDVQDVLDKFRKKLDQGQTFRTTIKYNLRKLRASSSYQPKFDDEIFLDIQITPLKLNSESSISHYLMHLQNITEQIRIKRKLREKERNFRAMAEQALIGIIIIQNNKIQFVNEIFAQILGYERDEIQSWRIEDFIEAIHPDDREMILNYVRKRQEGINDIPNRYETRALAKSGEVIWVENFAKSIRYDGEPADLVFISDISSRKKAEKDLKEHQEELNALIEDLEDKVEERTRKFRDSEKKYRSLYNNAIEGLAFHEIIYNSNNNPVDYIIRDVNPAFEQLTNKKKKYVINRSASEVYGISPPPLLETYGKVAETLKSKQIEYYFLPLKKFFRISVFSFEKGTFVTLFDDITEKKKAENKLEQSERKYKRAYNRANFYKDLFAHDINNFLQNIHSASELIAMELSDIKEKEYVDEWINIMQDQINKAAKLINNVQKISDLEESDKVLQDVDLCRVLNKSIDSLRSMYEGSLSEIMIDSSEEQVCVKANDLLEDVFDNLLINAIKHSDRDLTRIKIQISREILNDKEFVKLSFIDNGKGIKDLRKENIFQKGYERGDAKQGMGLGLYLVDKIIKSYGGKIWVKNRVKGDYSKGTKFIMLIPTS